MYFMYIYDCMNKKFYELRTLSLMLFIYLYAALLMPLLYLLLLLWAMLGAQAFFISFLSQAFM